MRVRYHRWPAVTGGAERSARSVGWSWRVMVSIRRAYGRSPGLVWHPLPGTVVAGVATIVACAAATRGGWVPITLVAAAVAVIGGARDVVPWRVTAIVAVVALTSGVRCAGVWQGNQPRHLGPFTGWATVVGDPQPYPSSVRVVLELDGERFELWARGRAKTSRVSSWNGGDRVLLQAERDPLDAERAARVAWQHVVGELHGRLVRRRARRERRRPGEQSRARVDPPRRRRAPGRRCRAVPRPGDRRRPRAAARDGRAVPCERPVPPHRGVRPERRVRARRRRPAAAPAAGRGRGGASPCC